MWCGKRGTKKLKGYSNPDCNLFKRLWRFFKREMVIHFVWDFFVYLSPIFKEDTQFFTRRNNHNDRSYSCFSTVPSVKNVFMVATILTVLFI